MDSSDLIIRLVIAVVFGVICAAIADSKGRSGVGWFFVGMLFPCIGLIIILCLSNLKEEQARFDQLNEQNRGLKERLRQEQIKNEAFRQHAAERLDAHDNALGMSTRSTTPVLASSSSPPLIPPDAETPMPEPSPEEAASPEVEWYYVLQGERRGPVFASEIVRRIQSGELTTESPVWSEALSDWTPLDQVPQFRPLLPS